MYNPLTSCYDIHISKSLVLRKEKQMLNTETYLEGRIRQLGDWIAQLETGSLFLADHPAAGVNLYQELDEERARLVKCQESKRREVEWAADNTTATDWLNEILAEYV